VRNRKQITALARERRSEIVQCRTAQRVPRQFPLACMIAPMVLDGPINGDAFQAYVEQVLVPQLAPGDTVVMCKRQRGRTVNPLAKPS
jgi:hypothetical protein